LRNENLSGSAFIKTMPAGPGGAPLWFFARAQTPPPVRLGRPARSRFTTLRVWETLTGFVPLFSGCSLQ
jgi:hypothetical protein